jgi:iron complex outermembrane receptor protein
MVLAPEVSFNGMARYTWDLAGGASIAAQLDGSYSSSVYFDNLNSPALEEGSYFKANTRLSWLSSDGAWEAAAWVRNLTDEEYRIYAFDLTGDLGYVQDTYNAPRTYGVTVGMNF